MKHSYIIKGWLLLTLAGWCLTGKAQNFSTRFMENTPSAVLSVVTVNASMIDAMKEKETDKELVAFLAELQFLRVITINKSTSVVATYCREALTLLKNTGGYQELVAIEKGDQQIRIVAFPGSEKNKAQEIVLISCVQNNLTLVDITGHISIDKLGNLSRSIKKSMQKFN
jgi:hypothetical protein